MRRVESSNIDIGTITVAGTETGGGDDSAFSYQLKLGTTFEMNEKADVYVEGIYHETSDFYILGADFDPYKSLGARAGLRFKF
jgi:opacity protein-like surface antigen